MKVEQHGVVFDDLEIVKLCTWHGTSYLLKGKRQEVELRVTPSGLLRLGNIKPAGPITAKGIK